MTIQIGRTPDHDFGQPLGLLSDCHRRIEHFLEVLAAIAERESGGPLTEARRDELSTALTYFATAAPRHTADEEESLFPRLRAVADAATAETLGRLERDHEEADRHHGAVDTIGRRWLTAGSLDAGDVDELRAHLAALGAIYQAHIGVEDGELFPAAARLLTPDKIEAIGREMAARRRPDRRPTPSNLP